jgi:hypothetical protein
MAKSNRPVTGAVSPGLLVLPEFQALLAKGNDIRDLTSVDGEWLMYHADFIMTEHAWRMSETLVKYLDTAIKGVRAKKYGTKKGTKDESD